MSKFLLDFSGYIVIDASTEEEAFNHGQKLFNGLIERSGYDMGISINEVEVE